MNQFVNKELIACALETKNWPNVLNNKTRLIKEPSEIKLMFPRKPDSCKYNTEKRILYP